MKKDNRTSMVQKVLAFGLLFATMASVAHAEGGAGRLPGTWDITLTVLDCADRARATRGVAARPPQRRGSE